MKTFNEFKAAFEINEGQHLFCVTTDEQLSLEEAYKIALKNDSLYFVVCDNETGKVI